MRQSLWPIALLLTGALLWLVAVPLTGPLSAEDIGDPDEIQYPDAQPRAHDEIEYPDAQPRAHDEIPYPDAKPRMHDVPEP